MSMSVVGNIPINLDRHDQVPHHQHYPSDYADSSDDPTTTSTPTANDDDTATLDEDARAQGDVVKLARRLSRISTTKDGAHHLAAGEKDDPLHPQQDSIYDPWSSNFDPVAWAKAVYSAHSSDPEAVPLRTSGVAFANLSVHGFGTDTDYQSTVGNSPLKAIGSGKALLGGNAKKKIQILQGLDGILESGEMLVVLGPPGRCVAALGFGCCPFSLG